MQLLDPLSIRWAVLLLLSIGCLTWLAALIWIERRRRRQRSVPRLTVVVEADRASRLH